MQFLEEVLPPEIPQSSQQGDAKIQTPEDFIADVEEGMKVAPMAVRITPHILSVVDWRDPVADPVRRQFIPMKSSQISDHPSLELDSLHEEDDSPVPGLVHRYPEKVLFLGELGKSFHLTTSLWLITRSYICVSRVLSVLHPLLCGWCRHRIRDQEI